MTTKIRDECNRNLILQTQVGKYSLPIYDQVVYCDVGRGTTGGSGESWETATNTVNGALDRIYSGSNSNARGRHFLILFQSRLTSGNVLTTKTVIDIQGVSLIGAGLMYGMGGGWDSCFVNYHTMTAESDLSGAPFTKAGLSIEADDCVVAGLKFYNPDATQKQVHLTTNDAHGARNCAIINNVFQGQNGTADRTSGVQLVGSETALVADNQFYQCEYGVTLHGGGTRYVNRCIVENNKIFSPKYGIYLSNSSTTDNLIIGNTVVNKQTYGYTMTDGIYCANAAQGNLFQDNVVGHATEGTAYAAGSGTNYWINNYYSGSGGSKFDGAD